MSIYAGAAALAMGLVLLLRDEPEPNRLAEARVVAIDHIKKSRKGSAVVFDFDDTLFDPSAIQGVAHTMASNNIDRRSIPLYKPIQEICDVLRVAASNGMYIVLITARPDSNLTKSIVMANFNAHHLPLHELYANPSYPNLNNFKAKLRNKIKVTRPICLTIGDQWTDVNEANGYEYIKLPNKREPMMVTSLT